MREKRKLWTVGQIDATGIRGPHEKELEDISQNKFPLFIDMNIDVLRDIVANDLGGIIENIGLDEDWTITIEMFPEVSIHICFFYYGHEFGDGIEAEFKFFFSGENANLVPGEDSATYIDIIMDFLERMIHNKEPFEKSYDKRTDLMVNVLKQRKDPFKLLKDEDKEKLSTYIGAKVWITTNGWRIKKELFPNIYTEIIWDNQNNLNITFSGDNISKKIGSYHAEFLGIFVINHILRYITLNNLNKELPDICYIMFSRMFTKEKGWDHRRT